jgi:type I restriction enzyme S subunit
MKWETVNLGDVLHLIIGGGTPSKSKSEYWNGDIFWCSVKDMEDDKHYLSYTKDTITKKGLENSSANLIKAGTVITSTRMGLGRAFINKVDMAINQDLKALIPNERIDNRFLLWTIVSKRNELNMLGRGSTVKGITLDILKSIEIALPPLIVQRRIADILSAYDDLIENNQKQIKLLEEVAMRLYKEWFVNLRFPGHENTKIVDGVPEGWICSKTKDFIKFKYGKALKADDRIEGRYPVYGSSGVVGYHNEFLVEAPVVIVGRKGNVGSVYISFVNAFPIDTVYYIESEISIYYSYFNLLTRSFINNDSAVPGLNRNYAESMEMLCPSKYLQNEFDNKVSLLFERQNNLRHQIDLLKQARDKLLPKLMSGEIEV